jgi:putative NADPH-quinone reductase
MTRILVVNGHPDSSRDRLCAALADAYEAGAEKAGHSVRRLDIGRLAFAPLSRPADFLIPPDEPDILAAQEDFRWAEHLVFLYPLWLGGPPAHLKAFLEQLARGGFVVGTENGLPKGRLKGRSARMIVTMGMPAPFYRLFYGAHGVRAFKCSILGLAGIRPVRTSYFGGIDRAGRAAAIVEKVESLGRRAA